MARDRHFVRRREKEERIQLGSQGSADPPAHLRDRVQAEWTERAPHDEANVPRRAP